MVWSVRRTPHPEAGGLADLVGDVYSFLADDLYRGHRFLRGHAARLVQEVTAESLWDNALSGMTREPAFRVVRNGTTLASSSVCRTLGMGSRDVGDVLNPNSVVDAYRSGASLALQGLHHTDPRLGRWATNLALELDQPVQINAYLSPPATQALDLHFDFHDVVVVQLRGSKRWRAWPTLARAPYPVKGASTSPPMPTMDELGEPIFDEVLRRGDVLYLPRGFAHCAQTTDECSDHLTFGLISVLWQRVVRMALDAEIAAGRLAESLPAGLLAAEQPGLKLPDLGGLAAHVDGDAFAHYLACQVWRRHPPTRVKPLTVPAEVRGDQPLRWVPGPLVWATSVPIVGRGTGAAGRGEQRAVIGLGDRVLDLPDEVAPLICALLAADDGLTVDGVAAALERNAATEPGTHDPDAARAAAVEPGTDAAAVEPGTDAAAVEPGTDAAAVEPGTDAVDAPRAAAPTAVDVGPNSDADAARADRRASLEVIVRRLISEGVLAAADAPAQP